MLLLSARDLNIAQPGRAVHIPNEYLIKRAKLHAWNVCKISKHSICIPQASVQASRNHCANSDSSE